MLRAFQVFLTTLVLAPPLALAGSQLAPVQRNVGYQRGWGWGWVWFWVIVGAIVVAAIVWWAATTNRRRQPPVNP
jgi:heme/copper-type cytochrome/quinol oxidase subunit 2